MASRLGHHLLLSLGVITATALLAALPALLSGALPGEGHASVRSGQASVATLAELRDGKIVDRLDRTAMPGDAETAGSPITPAMLAMPMSLSWPDAGEWAPARLATLAERRTRTGEGAPHLASRRNAPAPARTIAAAGPLVILPAAPVTAIEVATTAEATHDDSWSRLVLMPATKIGDAVSGAAGGVQAVGSWGLSQAASLLPRW